MSEPIKNLFSLMGIVSTPDTIEQFMEDYNTCRIRYGDLKKQLAEDIIKATDPLREKIQDILSDDAYIRKAASMGQEKARESASKTLREVREIIGFKPF
jgi:tryptophanyl-tRNA synthetase